MENAGILFISGVIILLYATIPSLVFVNKTTSIFRRFSLSLIMLACILLSLFSLIVISNNFGGNVYNNNSINNNINNNLGTNDKVNIIENENNFNFSISLAGFQVSFMIDLLAAFFILLICIVAFCVSIYSFSYIEHSPSCIKRNILVSLGAIFIASMILIVASSNLVGFLMFWEIMSLSSFMLVMFDYEKEETKKAGIFYFVMTQLSTVFLLGAFIIIYNFTGSLELTSLSTSLNSLSGTSSSTNLSLGITNLSSGILTSGMLTVLFIFLMLGFGIKAGVIPFHKWLPYAHPASPSSISALMSGVMIKVAIYGIVRFILILPEQKIWWGVIILILGTISAVLGVIYALKEHDLKRLLAYHSIENIGIILMGIGLYLIFLLNGFRAIAILALAGALFHTLNHALFKSLLFLTAGSVVQSTHTKNIEEMGGLVKTMPYTALLFLIGAISISALPPFNGFVSELMIFEVFFKTNVLSSPILKVILFISLSLFAMTSALAAACFVKAFSMVFLAMPRSKEALEAREVSWAMRIGPAILALLCIALGVFSFQIFQFIGKNLGLALNPASPAAGLTAELAFPIPNLMLISIIGGVFLIFVISLLYFISSRKSRISETWGCGLYSQNSKMEYTASGFSEPIVTIFSSIYQTKKINNRAFHDQSNSVFKEGTAEIKLIKFFEEYLYAPFSKAVQSISFFLYRLQNKVELDSYILYGFLTIIIVLVVLGLRI